MAESKRVSGKGKVSTRQSGRGGAQPVPPQGVSGRDTRVTKRTIRTSRGGKELVISGGLIAVLLIICGIVYVSQSSTLDKQERVKRAEKKYFDDGFDRIASRFPAAEEAGRKFCMGEEVNCDPNNPDMRKAMDDKLFGQFRGDSEVYNVVYERSYRKANKTYPDQRYLNEGLIKYDVLKTETRNGVQIQFGYVDGKAKDQALFIASKNYTPANKEDKVNLGGRIVLVIKWAKPPNKD